MSDKKQVYHRLVCDWPGCEETEPLSILDGKPTYGQAVRDCAYVADEPYDYRLRKDWMHDPSTGRDYCADHWHYEQSDDDERICGAVKMTHRAPGPDLEDSKNLEEQV